MSNERREVVVLCPGQGAQAVGMGRAWAEKSVAAKAVLDEADRLLAAELGVPLSALCFDGPAERLNRTDISQPAIYACSIASLRGLEEQGHSWTFKAVAGLSLGEYTALYLAGVFDFATGLKLVALRGRLMQEAAERSEGGMVALIGGDDVQAQEVCDRVAVQMGGSEVLVCANFNAPGQVVLSGHARACERAVGVALEMGLRATPLKVAGAFHSPLMRPAADGLAKALAGVNFAVPAVEAWSNVTAQPHESESMELLKRRLVEQLVSPVKWAQTCQTLASRHTIEYHELAPGSVLRGLMRRIDRSCKVTSHEEP